MKKILISVGTLLLVSVTTVAARAEKGEQNLVYDSFKNETARGKVLYTTFVTYKELPDQQTAVNRKKEDVTDDFILDKDYDLVQWRRVTAEDRTDFIVKREGETLVVTGTFKGRPIKKKIPVEGKEVHIYPNYSLGKFALSGQKSMKHWSLRRDEMTKLPMTARNDGEETIKVNGKDVKTIKVYYTIEGKMREKHFNHTYYYRKSDGLFIKKKEVKGEIEELTKEN